MVTRKNCVVALQAWEQVTLSMASSWDHAAARTWLLYFGCDGRSTQVNEEGRQKKVVGTDPTPGAELRDGSLVLVRQDSSGAIFTQRITRTRFCCSELYVN